MRPEEAKVGEADVQAARSSYERVASDLEFFRTFYRKFFELCPDAEPKFAHTDFERQIRLLRHAIGLLLSYPSSAAYGPSLLARVAERHSRRELDVPPKLYAPFVEALIDTAKRLDGKFSAEVEAAWRTTLGPGIEYMKGRY